MATTKPEPAAREAQERETILEAFRALCPEVYGNPFIPHWPLPAQVRFLGLHQHHQGAGVFQALYGGAAGGGKSDCMLMAAAQYAWRHGDFAGICFRRTYSDLVLPGALLDRAMAWWVPAGARWDGTSATFRFPSGAKVTMSYLYKPNDHLRYASTEFQLACFDELTHWPTPKQYDFVGLSRVRRSASSRVPLRTLSASNPGGPGHQWVKDRFIGGVDPATGLYVKPRHLYVPSRLDDNPHLDRESYARGLEQMHPTVRDQLLRGDWSARDPGDYFRVEWFGSLLDPATDLWPSRDCVRIRWWDLAASEATDAARTAGVRMARHRSGVRAIEHCAAFRATPGARDDRIAQVAAADGHGVVVGLEIEGGSGGPAQFESLSARLRAKGFRVVGARPRVIGPELTDRERAMMTRSPATQLGKAGRADPVASCLERGYQRRGESLDNGSAEWGRERNHAVATQTDGIRLFAGPWTQDYLDEVVGFPQAARCDVVDATSGAWAWLEAHPVSVAPARFVKITPDETQNVHPEDREPDAPRRWNP